MNYFPTLILELVRQHSNYLRFWTSIEYHLEITQEVIALIFLFFIFRGKGNNILTFFFFYVLNFPKKYVLDLR
jgi:hypothetical protein